MKKRLISLVTILAMIAAFVTLPTTVSAEAVASGTCGDNLTWTLEDGVLTISGTGDMYDYSSSSTAPWYDYLSEIAVVVIKDGVTSIGEYVFLNHITITNVDISDSVTIIGNHAFGGCSALTSITIPNSVTTIGDGAFARCSNLTTVNLSNNITSISKQMFYYCFSLTNVTIPNGVITIAYGAFEHCSKLISVDIPNSVTKIDAYAFNGCSGLTEITIPDSVSLILHDAFAFCSNLKSITIPEGITSIYSNTFYGCYSMTSVTMPDTLKVIGDEAFYGCSALTRVTLPSNVTEIGGEAFRGCSNLTSIIISPNTKTICNAAFEGCSSLVSIDLPSDITTISNLTFAYCSSLTSIEIPSKVRSIGSYAFEYCSSLTSIKIPNSVESIGTYAFQYCSGLTSIEIPNSVTNISKYAFYKCSSLTDVYYSGSEEEWSEISIDSNNTCLNDATIHYNSTYDSFDPTTPGDEDSTDATTPDDTDSDPDEEEETEEETEEPSDTFIVEVYYLEQSSAEKLPVANANVTCCGITSTTDAEGLARFAKESLSDTGSLTATAENFYDYEYAHWIRPENGRSYICMKYNDGQISLKSLTATSSDGKVYNLKAGRKLSVAYGSAEKYTFSCEINWNDHDPGEVYLYGSESGKKAPFSGGSLLIPPAAIFDIDETVNLVAYTADGEYKLSTDSMVSVKEPAVSLPVPTVTSDTISQIPFFNSEKVKIEFGEELQKYGSVKVEDDKLTVEFGASGKDKVSGDISVLSSNEVKMSLGGKLEVPLSNDAEWKGEVTVAISDAAKTPSSKQSDSSDGVQIADVKYNTGVYVGPAFVPFTGTLGVAGTLTGTLGVSGTWETPKVYGSLDPTIGVDAFAGPGVTGDTVEISGGAYIAAKGSLKVQYTATQGSDFDFSPSVTGNIGLRINCKVWDISIKPEFEIGSFKWSKDGFKAEWLGDDVTALSLEDDVTLIGRAYLADGGGFVGDNIVFTLYDLETTNKNEQLIYENIFNNSEAVLQNIDGTTFLIYTIDDTERDEQNGLKLVYSTQNSDGTWSVPNAIDDDGTLDSVAVSDGKFVIWEDMKNILTADTADLQEIFSQTEISAAHFDGSEWISEKLTANDVYDFAPTISADGDTAIAAWLTNSDSDFSSQNGITSLNVALYQNSEWTVLNPIEDIGTVTRLTSYWNGTTGHIIYKNGDSLYCADITDTNVGVPTELEYNDVVSYTLGKHGDEAVLAYIDSGNTMKIVNDLFGNSVETAINSDLSMNSIPIIRSNGSDMYVCWNEWQNGYNTLSGVRYENGEWSDKITFISEDANIMSPDLLVNNDGTFTASYFKTGAIEVSDGSYTTGAVDLYVNTISPTYNLTVDSVTCDDTSYSESGTADITVNVKNTGENAVSGYTIELYNGEELVQTVEYDTAIKAGETQSAEISYTPESTVSPQELTIKILPSDVDDFDESDNSISLTLGTVDVTVSSAYFTHDESGLYFVNAFIDNIGSVTAASAAVQVHKNSAKGDIVYELQLSDIAPGTEQYIITPIEVTSDAENYVVTVSSDEDANEYNNFSIAVLDKDVSYAYTIDEMVVEDNTVTVTFTNNFDENGGILIIAAYNSDGVLTAISSADMSEVENTLTIDIDTANAQYISVFIWDDADNLIPLSKKYYQIITEE